MNLTMAKAKFDGAQRAFIDASAFLERCNDELLCLILKQEGTIDLNPISSYNEQPIEFSWFVHGTGSMELICAESLRLDTTNNNGTSVDEIIVIAEDGFEYDFVDLPIETQIDIVERAFEKINKE